ncbi:hypothetical protein K438DRAFT_2178351 [Mycena galopus ATCC 62051]|nr:hypothetical protein K438DRAFT_2178351 [Mycena galopus ATCC 62051]
MPERSEGHLVKVTGGAKFLTSGSIAPHVSLTSFTPSTMSQTFTLLIQSAENVVYKPSVGRSSPNLYVTIDCDGDRLGKTPVLKRNLAPKWDFKLPLSADSASAILTLRLCHESSFLPGDKSSITIEKMLRLCASQEVAQIDVKKKATVLGKLQVCLSCIESDAMVQEAIIDMQSDKEK